MKIIRVLHGPNLNLLGLREHTTYGSVTLSDINDALTSKAYDLGFKISIIQSNSEHEIISIIHKSLTDDTDYFIINPAAFTHTSIAIRDALLAVKIPFIEVHISNIYKRESFRHISYFSDIATGVITGLGADGYLLALQAISTISNRERNS